MEDAEANAPPLRKKEIDMMDMEEIETPKMSNFETQELPFDGGKKEDNATICTRSERGSPRVSLVKKAGLSDDEIPTPKSSRFQQEQEALSRVSGKKSSEIETMQIDGKFESVSQAKEVEPVEDKKKISSVMSYKN
eukprot:TRINITY_DN1623_c0_g1_i2.p1 TRINITY_DN1623_c0_g1~~TRINITY_DN1623_c0_g1_i2.p1  ORF type:complete len:136 (+),score=41.79 TRINITY_DN1623_c0_g1_i2:289-696(+)